MSGEIDNLLEAFGKLGARIIRQERGTSQRLRDQLSDVSEKARSYHRACEIWKQIDQDNMSKLAEAEKELAFLRKWKETNERQRELSNQLLKISNKEISTLKGHLFSLLDSLERKT